MDNPRRVRVLLNSRSGSPGDAPAETIHGQFKENGCECSITLLDRATDLRTLAAADSADIAWIAAGGDGTVNCVAQVVARTKRAMGVLPCGTLNHFAQDSGIPVNVEEAVALAATGSAQTMDAAEVNGTIFVNNSSLGVYPQMAYGRDRMRRSGVNKWWALLVASVKTFTRLRYLDVEFQCKGEILRRRTQLLFVGNNVYGLEGGELGKRSCLDEGILLLVLAPHATRIGLLRLVAAAFGGRARRARELEQFTATSFTVKTKRRHIRVSIDGEVRHMTPPLIYKSLPGALQVIAPTSRGGT